MSGSRHGFTAVEIIVVIACMALIAIPLWETLRSGTRASMSGIRKVESALEADQILRVISQDLRASVYIRPTGGVFNPLDLDLSARCMASSGACLGSVTMTIAEPFPRTVYSWLRFPSRGEIVEFVPLQSTQGVGQRRLSRVSYWLEPNASPKRGFRLWREEILDNAGSAAGGSLAAKDERKMLSDRVNYFAIRTFAPAGATDAELFWVNLSLYEAAGIDGGRVAGGQSAPATPWLADYYAVAGSEYFRATRTVAGYRPCYYVEPFSGPMKWRGGSTN